MDYKPKIYLPHTVSGYGLQTKGFLTQCRTAYGDNVIQSLSYPTSIGGIGFGSLVSSVPAKAKWLGYN